MNTMAHGKANPKRSAHLAAGGFGFALSMALDLEESKATRLMFQKAPGLLETSEPNLRPFIQGALVMNPGLRAAEPKSLRASLSSSGLALMLDLLY